MPCPFSGRNRRSAVNRISRRSFIASVVALGGTVGLSACLSRERERTDTPEEELEFPSGPTDLSTLPQRQHAWNEYLIHEGHGNTILPRHQVLLLLNYTGSIPPTDAERTQVERAFTHLEAAYQRGTGGRRDAMFNEGLLFMVGYTPTYFDRFDTELPPSTGLDTPEHVLRELSEDPAKADEHDALIVLNSDYASVVLSAEEALFGTIGRLNGVDVESDLSGVFERADRRTGFVGRGLPARKLDVEDIPESAPLSMGFKSGFTGSQAPEDKVTIDEGPFAGGTTQMMSLLGLDLERWYELEDEEQVSQMFSPAQDLEAVGETGQLLGNDSGITKEIAEQLETDAESTGRVGHSQKLATVRDEDYDPLILRRSEGNATNEFGPALNFTSIQQSIDDFVKTRKAMNAPELDDQVNGERHGIREFVTVKHRATSLIPPRRNRSLPTPQPEQ